MIRVNLSKDNIIIKGHSLYDDKGKDIVCSAVSSIVITTVNGILSIDKDAIIVNSSDGYIEIKINKNSDVVNKLIDNMISLLKSLSLQYKENIMIKDGE